MIEDSSTFVLTNEQNLITITLKDPLVEEELETRDFYSFVVVATNADDGVGETAVLISLPQKTCEGMQITKESVKTTTVSTSVSTTIFSSSSYSEANESTIEFTTSVGSESTEATTLVDTETTEKNWNETTPGTTNGYCG